MADSTDYCRFVGVVCKAIDYVQQSPYSEHTKGPITVITVGGAHQDFALNTALETYMKHRFNSNGEQKITMVRFIQSAEAFTSFNFKVTRLPPKIVSVGTKNTVSDRWKYKLTTQ